MKGKYDADRLFIWDDEEFNMLSELDSSKLFFFETLLCYIMESGTIAIHSRPVIVLEDLFM